MSDTVGNTDLVRSMRALADFLEARPNFPRVYAGGAAVLLKTKDELIHAAKMMGSAEKFFDDTDFNVRKRFGELQLTVYIPREQVCTRIVTGTRVVEAVPEHVEEIVKWECGDTVLTRDVDDQS